MRPPSCTRQCTPSHGSTAASAHTSAASPLAPSSWVAPRNASTSVATARTSRASLSASAVATMGSSKALASRPKTRRAPRLPAFALRGTSRTSPAPLSAIAAIARAAPPSPYNRRACSSTRARRAASPARRAIARRIDASAPCTDMAPTSQGTAGEGRSGPVAADGSAASALRLNARASLRACSRVTNARAPSWASATSTSLLMVTYPRACPTSSMPRFVGTAVTGRPR